ncbi:hypothetical protein pb186bvf_020936 [Paramecium bursaria]
MQLLSSVCIWEPMQYHYYKNYGILLLLFVIDFLEAIQLLNSFKFQFYLKALLSKQLQEQINKVSNLELFRIINLPLIGIDLRTFEQKLNIIIYDKYKSPPVKNLLFHDNNKDYQNQQSAAFLYPFQYIKMVKMLSTQYKIKIINSSCSNQRQYQKDKEDQLIKINKKIYHKQYERQDLYIHNNINENNKNILLRTIYSF